MIQKGEEFDYEMDLKQRQKDHSNNVAKKVPHLSHDGYRSKGYIKNSEHLRGIVNYPSKLHLNHKVILSTD